MPARWRLLPYPLYPHLDVGLPAIHDEPEPLCGPCGKGTDTIDRADRTWHQQDSSGRRTNALACWPITTASKAGKKLTLWVSLEIAIKSADSDNRRSMTA